ncbi:hypothetical protein J3R82DRAFT_11850 [Butyriboletus roseoflavus]|nr:hypothetical protein J3R82DRAFT_11850 [Butyriboletus roseoflavus]
MDKLSNALLQVHFTIHHTVLSKQTPSHDTFRANIKQIIILQRGKSSTAIYRTSDPHQGPVKLFYPSTSIIEPPAKRSKADVTSSTIDKGKGKESTAEKELYESPNYRLLFSICLHSMSPTHYQL